MRDDNMAFAGSRRLLLVLVSLVGLAGGAAAADLAPAREPPPAPAILSNGWTFSVMPYVWAAGISGRTAQFGLPPVNINLSFRNVVDHLDSVAMATVEARYDRTSLFGDLVYLDVSKEKATPRGILAGAASLSFSAMSATIGGGYSLIQEGTSHLDIVAAARLWNLDSGLSFFGGLFNGVSRSDNATWVDGLVGIRGTYSFTPSFYLTGWALAGAGGARFDWDLSAALGYRFNQNVSVLAGYRAVGIDYNRNNFVFNVVQRGPTVALKVEF